MNTFEFQVNKNRRRNVLKKSKNDKGLKDVTKSRYNSNRKRSLTLLNELEREKKEGIFIDQRFRSEHGDSSHVFDSINFRLRGLKQKNSRKAFKPNFNLDDKESFADVSWKNEPHQSTGNMVLTHRGTPIADLTDKILTQKQVTDDDTNENTPEYVDAVSHFSSGIPAEVNTQSQKGNKTRKEVFNEIILKSKQNKAENVKKKDALLNQLEELDEKFNDVKSLLKFKPLKSESPEANLHEQLTPEETEYKNLLTKLQFETRCKPTDRFKTQIELAAEQAEMFRLLEEKRLKATMKKENIMLQDSDYTSTHDEDKEDDDEEDDNEESDNEEGYFEDGDAEGDTDEEDKVDDNFEDNYVETNLDEDEEDRRDNNEDIKQEDTEETKEREEEQECKRKLKMDCHKKLNNPNEDKNNSSTGDCNAYHNTEKATLDSQNTETYVSDSHDSDDYTVDTQSNKEDGKHFQESEPDTNSFQCSKHDSDTTKSYPGKTDNLHLENDEGVKTLVNKEFTRKKDSTEKNKNIFSTSTHASKAYLEYISNIDSRKDVFLQKIDDGSDLPFFNQNEENEWERNLPFYIAIPDNFAEFDKLVKQFIPSAQRKLICRMIAVHNQHLSPDNLKKLETLLEFLLKYSIQELTKQFNEGKVYYTDENFKDKKVSIPNMDHLDAIASIFSLKICISELFNMVPKVFMEFFTKQLLQASFFIFPEAKKHIEKFLLVHSNSFNSELLKSSETETVSFSHVLALFHLLFTFYPKSERNIPIITPALMLLDRLGQQTCELYNFTFHILDCKEKNSESLLRGDSAYIKAIQSMPKSFHLSENVSLSNSVCLLGIMFQYARNSSPTYLTSLFPLAAVVLEQVSTDSLSTVQKLLCNICDNLINLFNAFIKATKKSSMDLVITQIMLPALFRILQSNSENIFIHKLNNFLINYLQKSVTPIHLGKTTPEGIRMLYPKFVNATTPTGARYLRVGKISEEAFEIKKLKRNIKSEMRGASKQLRHDAEVLNYIQAQKKRKENALRERKRKRILGVLENDAQEIHRMQTSVVPQKKQKRSTNK